MAVEAPKPHVVYLVERLPPQAPDPDSVLEKIKHVAAPLLVTIGLIILGCATVALAGHVFAFLVIEAATVQMLFMTSVITIISGFHLSRGVPFTAEISGGPFAVSI